MRIAIVGDLHFIAPDQEFTELGLRRNFFADAWPSFRKLADKINEASPDLVICLGDLVDWYSEANRVFALEMLSALQSPWLAAPGNHDFVQYARDPVTQQVREQPRMDTYSSVKQGWLEKGVEFRHRVVSDGKASLVLLNSAFSDVPPHTKEWLNSLPASGQGTKMLFTHVPLDIPPVREYILSVDPSRSMQAYVQSHAPWLYRECVEGRFSHVFTGHLHFPGKVMMGQLECRMLGMGIEPAHRAEREPASAAVMDTERPQELTLLRAI